MEYAFIFLALCVGLIIGFVISKLIAQNKNQEITKSFEFENQKLTQNLQLSTQQLNEAKSQLQELNQTHQVLQTEKNLNEQNLNINIAQKEALISNLNEKLHNQQEEYIKLQEKFTKDFELLASKILEEKSTKFTEQNKQNIQSILEPLQEKILHFEKRVDDTHKENIERNSQLREQIFNLKSLNEQMTKETLNLTKALKGDSKMQGNWGELVLERVLEKSGLEKGREYEVQQSFTLENGSRQMPDVIIHLPGGKKMIIDSKVSLTAYEQYVNAEDDAPKELFLKEHLRSVNQHIDTLSAKNYYDLYKIESPDFVLMFIPIEPAFAVALNAENQLYNKAFAKNIVIVTPSTLLATLRTIDTMWNNEKQQQNAIEIARQAGALYDKFEGLIADLTQVGKRMDDAKKEYGNAMNKLFEGRGNLIISVEKLKKMGASAKKSLPEPIINRAIEGEKE